MHGLQKETPWLKASGRGSRRRISEANTVRVEFILFFFFLSFNVYIYFTSELKNSPSPTLRECQIFFFFFSRRAVAVTARTPATRRLSDNIADSSVDCAFSPRPSGRRRIMFHLCERALLLAGQPNCCERFQLRLSSAPATGRRGRKDVLLLSASKRNVSSKIITEFISHPAMTLR